MPTPAQYGGVTSFPTPYPHHIAPGGWGDSLTPNMPSLHHLPSLPTPAHPTIKGEGTGPG